MPGTNRRSWKRSRKSNRYTRMVKRVGASYRKRSNLGWIVHKFNRSCMQTESLLDVDTFGQIQFALNDLPNYTDFTNLFEFYQITGVKLTFIWDKNSADNNTNAGSTAIDSFIPNLFLARDIDGGSAYTTIDQMLERGDTKFKRMDKPYSIYVKPKIRMETYDTALLSGYVMSNGWVDTVNYAVDYHGIRWAVDGGINGGTGQDPIGKLRIIKKYYFKCKGSQ